MRHPWIRTRLLGDYPRLIGRNILNGRYRYPPVSFFMLQRLQRDWGTRDTWTWGRRGSWARVYYRWVLLDSFLIRFLVPSHHNAAPFTLLSFCLRHRARFLLPPEIPGMIQPDPRINHLSSKLDNGFVPSFIAYLSNCLNIYRLCSRLYVTSTSEPEFIAIRWICTERARSREQGSD